MEGSNSLLVNYYLLFICIDFDIVLKCFTRSVATTGQVPVPREQGLAISIGDNIYYYGGRGRGNNILEEIAGSVFHVYDTKSASWSKIEVKPPRRCSDLSIYGTAIGTNIWIYDRGFWLCFDTVERQWRNVDLSVKKDDYLSLHLSSIGVIGQSLYYYDGNHNSFEKKVYQINTATAQISTSDAEGFGDHPQERHDMFMHAVSEDILILYAPVDSYEKAKAEKRGELFYYDLKEAKWARGKQVKNDPALNLYAYYYIGRLGSSLYFAPRRDADANEWWALDLLTATWEKKIIKSDKVEVSSNYATVVGDKLYCWMADGTMTVVDTEGMPTPEQQRQIDEQLAQMAREALSHIKPPVTIVDEYIPEPILINTDLDPVNRTKPVIHREIAKDFSNIFPLLDQQKIIESTVATPSESVFMHKNYIHYLTLAWANHFSVILSPDIIFYTVLCEIADEILTNPDAFRHLFTGSMEKKPIMTITHDASNIDLNQLIEGIAKNLPVDASIFTANFSCSTAESRLAIQSAFCEAMSAYYFYMSTMCGIPRVKVLGTKQDWETVEHKIHRMRTEVFNQDGSSNQKMSLYLKNAEEQTHKLYTTRDPAFWKDMFGIARCMSGHTDVVEGWINMFYRQGYASKHGGVVRYLSDDFYNLKAHISTVKWQNVETQQNFELKSGLLYSNVVAGESPEDIKFPWLEPQFCHVIVETDGGKMSPETFKKYIETTLKGRDKKLMQQFYDVLKDDPIELVKGGTNEINFRFELVSRLMEHRRQEFLKTGQAPSVFDLNAEPFKSALDFYTKMEKSNDKAFTKMKNKIIEYLELNTNITGFHNQHLFAAVEHEFIDVLMKKPQRIQELTVLMTTQRSIEKVSQFFLNPSCNLVCFNVGRTSMSYDAFKPDTRLDYSALAAALINTKAPLHTLVFGTIKSESIAKAVADLCRRPNGLKNLQIESHFGESDPEITKILVRGQVESKTLTSISLQDLGRKEVVIEGHKKWVDVESDELKECIMKNLPLNPSLEAIGVIRFKFTPAEQVRVLSIPSLKSIKFNELTDMSFLDATTKLELINCTLNCTAEQIAPLQKFVTRADCALKTLSVEKSTLYPGAGAILGKGLVHNRSITVFNLRKSTIKSEDDILAIVESVVEWLEKPYCQLETLNLSEMSNFTFEGANLQRLLIALKANKTLKKILVNVACTIDHLPLFIDLVQHNSTLTDASFEGTTTAELTKEEREQLIAAAKANKTLLSFSTPLLSRQDHKSLPNTFSIENFYR